MENYVFSVTSYAGFENEILGMRNANRNVVQTRKYLDWRYAKFLDAPDPLVFWIKSLSGETFGIASLIFRPFWVGNKSVYVAVLGDIALDVKLRGQGLGRRLMQYIKQYLQRNSPEQLAFVIPNNAAQKSLIAANWNKGGELIPYVLLYDPGKKLSRILKNELLAKLVTLPITILVTAAVRLRIKKGCEIQFIDNVDDSFDKLWTEISKENLVISDRGHMYLKWRYLAHPHEIFRIVKLTHGEDLAGYLIWKVSPAEKTCVIYDVLARNKKDLLCMLSLFILKIIQSDDIGTFRIVLNDSHPFRNALWKLGFIKRKAQGSFYVHWPTEFLRSNLNWCLSQGDKDI